ncbi:hypothetical protein V8C34DRAFT_134630 [Trichoderma compactum]
MRSCLGGFGGFGFQRASQLTPPQGSPRRKRMSDLVRAASGYNCVMVVETEVTVDTYTSDCLVLSCSATFPACAVQPRLGLVSASSSPVRRSSTTTSIIEASGTTHSLPAHRTTHTHTTHSRPLTHELPYTD